MLTTIVLWDGTGTGRPDQTGREAVPVKPVKHIKLLIDEMFEMLYNMDMATGQDGQDNSLDIYSITQEVGS